MEVLVMPADVDDPSGPEVVRKMAGLPGERERLLHEAVMLRMAADRGVAGLPVMVAAPSPDDPDPVLITEAAAGPSLSVAGPLPVLEVAGIAAEVARLLAGLHEAGLVHGAVEPGHVVLDGAGGAILVGFGRGGETGSLGGGDPRPTMPDRLDPAEDVAGWGALVSHLLDWSATAEEEPLLALRRALAVRPARRRGAPAPSRAADDDRRALAALADQAQDPDPAHRPTARSLGAAVAHRIPHARMPGRGARTSIVPTPSPALLDRLSGHLRFPATGDDTAAPRAAAVENSGSPAARNDRPSGAGISDDVGEDASVADQPGVARRALPSLRSGPHQRRVVAAGGAALLALGGLIVAVRPSAVAPTAVAPASRCPVVTGPSADVDADGCPEAVQWSDGVLQAGTARFALGAPGDGWAIGDWDCDGQPTPALLHEGSLTVFDAWPGPGAEVRGRPVTSAPGAHQLSAVAGSDGCDRASLGRPGAADLLVDPRAAP